MQCHAQLLLGISTKILLDESRVEAVKTGGHCRVGSEKVSCSGAPREFCSNKLHAKLDHGLCDTAHSITEPKKLNDEVMGNCLI